MFYNCLFFKILSTNIPEIPDSEYSNHISSAQISDKYFTIVKHLSTNMFHNCLFFSKYWVPTSQKFQILSTQITFQVLKFQISILQLSNTWVLTCFTIASFFQNIEYQHPRNSRFWVLKSHFKHSNFRLVFYNCRTPEY